MARAINANLQTILFNSGRGAEGTVEIYFPGKDVLRFATAPLTIGAEVYSNDVESIAEIRQTLENPSDRVRIALQNKNGVLGLHLADNREEWREATAVIGRYYKDKADLGLAEWTELFAGSVQKPESDDFRLTFEVVTDTLSKGRIVASGTLAYPCRFTYKDLATCGATSSETSCNHTLKSKGGCDGRNNAYRFGGMESRYNPDQNVPGTGGNIDIPVPPDRCPRVDQLILIEDYWGSPFPIRVSRLKLSDRIFNPVAGTFHEIKTLRHIPGVEIHKLSTANGAICYSSDSHLVLEDSRDRRRRPVSEFDVGEEILTFKGEAVFGSRLTAVDSTGRSGDVMEIEMKDGHIYAAGRREPFVVAHNLKNPYDTEEPPVS